MLFRALSIVLYLSLLEADAALESSLTGAPSVDLEAAATLPSRLQHHRRRHQLWRGRRFSYSTAPLCC